MVHFQPTRLATQEPHTSAEPSAAEISRAAWAWRNDKDRETDSSDDAYFRNNWQSLPGLRAYVTAQVELGRPLAEALAKAEPPR